MAITPTCNFGPNVTLPGGFINPTLPAITAVETGSQANHDELGTAANANPVTGASNLITLMETYLGGLFVTEKELAAAGTFNINATITSIIRINDGDDVSKFQTGTEQYRMSFTYEWGS